MAVVCGTDARSSVMLAFWWRWLTDSRERMRQRNLRDARRVVRGW